jgi:4-hydroxybenzoate polyprenyltransferase/phosphoserine phosphatase
MLSPAPALEHARASRDNRDLPLVIDLDGTLTPTDTLVESVLQLIKERPLSLLQLPFWMARGRAALKCRVAAATHFNAGTLPIRPEVLEWVRDERARGRRIVLATAAHESIAHPVAQRLDVFDQVLATTAERNLKGPEKLRAVQEEVGPDFVYAGDSSADLPIWHEARAAVLVGASPAVQARVRSGGTPVEREFAGAPGGLRQWLKALRVHQWAKNLLLFVPLVTGFAVMDMARAAPVLLAFLAFSLAASGTYIVNDLWDLDNDRAHPRKWKRPFASASLSIFSGLAMSAALLLTAMVLAALASTGFLVMLCVYVVMTSAYSWVLKRYVLIDVLMLALLYTLRVFAGSVAAHLPVSSWLLAFSVFLFFSLALVKRCSELVSLRQGGAIGAHGRDYQVGDLTVLWPLGVGSSLCAVVVLGLFISAPETASRYATPELMWLAALGLLYWVARLWIKTSRGEMHDDPIVFALKDGVSAVSIGAMLLVTVVAHMVRIGPF